MNISHIEHLGIAVIFSFSFPGAFKAPLNLSRLERSESNSKTRSEEWAIRTVLLSKLVIPKACCYWDLASLPGLYAIPAMFQGLRV